MSSRRDATSARGRAETGEPTEELGRAFAARAEDCLRICEERLASLNVAVLSDHYLSQRRKSLETGIKLLARWLQTGEESTAEERRFLGSLGEEAARSDVSIMQMTRGYLVFRDVVQGLLEEEARNLETPDEVLAGALRMNAASCDASILWMTRLYVRQKERLAAELEASEARFRGVYQSMAGGVVLLGPDGTVQDANEAAAEMLEVPREQLIGANVFTGASNYRDDEGRELRQVPTAEALTSRRPVRGRVVKHDFGDGRPSRWHQVDAIPIFGPDGELTQVVATISDVTAVKQAEELRAEGEAKNRFLATMSHELRTPLNSILGFAQLLAGQGGKLDDKQRRYLGNIESSGKQLMGLINDILELSRVASGQVVPEPEDISLEKIVADVATEFEPMFAAHAVDLRSVLEPGIRAWADPRRTHQVLANLVANAHKFTEQGSITISALREPDWVEIRVIDTGIGIPEDQLERVFDEFTQVDGGSTRSRGGTGLGLPLSRRLVELMGGTLTLESVYGSGTTAIVRLPPVP